MCQVIEAAHPNPDPPLKAHGCHWPPLREAWGRFSGTQCHCDGAYRPEAGGCQVWRALPAACAVLPATYKALAAQPHCPHTPSAPFPAPPMHSLPSGVSGEGLGARPGGEKGGGEGDGSSWEDAAKRDGNSGKGEVFPPAAMAQDGYTVTLPPLTCPAGPWPPVSSSTTSEGKTPTRPSKSPVQKPSSTSPGARGSTRMIAPSGKLSSSGLCPS